MLTKQYMQVRELLLQFCIDYGMYWWSYQTYLYTRTCKLFFSLSICLTKYTNIFVHEFNTVIIVEHVKPIYHCAPSVYQSITWLFVWFNRHCCTYVSRMKCQDLFIYKYNACFKTTTNIHRAHMDICVTITRSFSGVSCQFICYERYKNIHQIHTRVYRAAGVFEFSIDEEIPREFYRFSLWNLDYHFVTALSPDEGIT